MFYFQVRKAFFILICWQTILILHQTCNTATFSPSFFSLSFFFSHFFSLSLYRTPLHIPFPLNTLFPSLPPAPSALSPSTAFLSPSRCPLKSLFTSDQCSPTHRNTSTTTTPESPYSNSRHDLHLVFLWSQSTRVVGFTRHCNTHSDRGSVEDYMCSRISVILFWGEGGEFLLFGGRLCVSLALMCYVIVFWGASSGLLFLLLCFF